MALPATKIFLRSPPRNMDPPDNHLNKVIKPSIFMLNMFGLGNPNLKNKCMKFVYNIYTAFMLAWSVVFIVRKGMIMDWSIQKDMSADFLLVVWGVQCLLSAVSAMYVTRRDRISNLAKKWNEFRLDEMISTTGMDRKRRPCIVVLYIVGFLFMILAWSFAISQIAAPKPNYAPDMFGPSFLQHFTVVCVIIDCAMWMIHQMLFVATCYCAITAWKSFVSALEDHKKYTFYQTVSWASKMHGNLTEFVGDMSDTFGFYVLTQLAFSVPTLVMELYLFSLMVTSGKASTLRQKLEMCTWMSETIVQVAVICYAAYINSNASEATRKFYNIYAYYADKENADRENAGVSSPVNHQDGDTDLALYQKAGILLSRMQNENVSVSVCDLAPITKAFMLTMISVMFNYFFLLLQFALQEQPQDCKAINGTM